jgi:hypothetical protein
MVSGQVDGTMFGLGCSSMSVTGGPLQVTGTWTANADGTYADHTVTSGTENLSLPASCLIVSGTVVTCDKLDSLIGGYDSVTCTDAAGGGCTWARPA